MRRPLPQTIVEFGSGKSNALELIRGVLQAPECIGVDFSNEALTEQRERYPWGYWIQADLECPPVPQIPDESADFVFSSHVIEHMEDMYRFLDEQWRVLKPGGVMAIVAPLHSYWREHRHVLTVDAISGMLQCYSKPVVLFTDGRSSEVVAGVIKGGQ